MAEIEVRTPEDLDRVFTDIFNLLYKMQYEISNIESELRKLNTPTITTAPYIPPSPTWVSPHWGSSSLTPGKVTLVQDDLFEKLKLGGGDYEEKDNS